jgi:ATPase subunit of ABC transporter with duplicated ATPase domains
VARVDQYVFSMYRADKFYGPERQVLANISLSFILGAKIGVLGPNGAGKSTLLRIMAGREETSSGEARLAPGATVGLLEQEPELDPAKDVRGNVEDGVRELRDLLDSFEAISARFAEPDADYDTLLAEQAKVQEEIDRRDAWSLDATLDRAMDALRLPDGDRDVTTLSGGERQRVAVATLLAHDAPLMLLDEPIAHLDLKHQLRVLDHLAALARRDHAIVLSIHDLTLARRCATHALLLFGDGRVAAGRVGDVMSDGALTDAFACRVRSVDVGGRPVYVAQ